MAHGKLYHKFKKQPEPAVLSTTKLLFVSDHQYLREYSTTKVSFGLSIKRMFGLALYT